jgi:hypothetical protein
MGFDNLTRFIVYGKNMIEKQQLRDRLKKIWERECYTTVEIAKHIGVSAITFRRFVYNEGSIQLSTLMKINRWVGDMEREYER